jgi:exodeoxyribonuclease VII small subunit
MKKNQNDYDRAVTRLEKIVERIQNGEMGLEEMRQEVKSAIALIEQCRAKLRNIESDLNEILEEE